MTVFEAVPKVPEKKGTTKNTKSFSFLCDLRVFVVQGFYALCDNLVYAAPDLSGDNFLVLIRPAEESCPKSEKSEPHLLLRVAGSGQRFKTTP